MSSVRLRQIVLVLISLTAICIGQELWEQTHEAGVKASKESRFADAEKLLGQSLQIAHRSTSLAPFLGRNLIDLAEVYRTEGKYGEAQPLYEEALKVNSKQFGVDSAEVAEVLDRH